MNNDSFNDNDDNIRPPDAVVTEQLLQDTRDDFEKEIDEAIYLSYQDIREKQEFNRKYEEQILQEYNEETSRRKQIFEKLRFDLNKLSKIDKETKEVFDISEPIIEAYCSQYINYFKFDIKTYEKIFNLLSKIRTDKNAVEILKTIIILDELSA